MLADDLDDVCFLLYFVDNAHNIIILPFSITLPLLLHVGFLPTHPTQ